MQWALRPAVESPRFENTEEQSRPVNLVKCQQRDADAVPGHRVFAEGQLASAFPFRSRAQLIGITSADVDSSSVYMVATFRGYRRVPIVNVKSVGPRRYSPRSPAPDGVNDRGERLPSVTSNSLAAWRVVRVCIQQQCC